MSSFVFFLLAYSFLVGRINCSAHHPPTSELVSLSKSFRQGAEIRLLCNGESDQSMNFDWFFEGRRLSSEKEIKIVELSSESSALIIKNSRNDHSGNYSCRVTNSFEQSSSAHLLVEIEGTDRCDQSID